jgi:regulatory protein
VTAQRPQRRFAPRPLDEDRLGELALAYVARFATTRAKLHVYLTRKVRERGWDGKKDADVGPIVDRLVAQGYVDDAGFALGKARALTVRGYGKQRVLDRLRAAGVGEADGTSALAYAEDEALAAALRFAERRRIGPFAQRPIDRPEREKAIAAMVRAGHGFAIARALAELAPGAEIDADALAERARRSA